MNARSFGLLFGFLLAPVVVHADDRPPAGFRFERTITVTAPGPQRLSVDLDLLAGAAPDFSDLRVFDEHGAAVPYLVVPPEPRGDTWQSATQLVATTRTREHSGFEADLGGLFEIDRVRILGLPTPLMKRVRLEASADRVHYNLLSDDETVFDLPAQGLRRLDVGFAPGRYRYIRGTWDNRGTSPIAVPDRMSARIVSEKVPASPLISEVAFDRQPSKTGTSRFRVRLPGKGLHVQALELDVGETELHRQAIVTEPRLSGRQLEPVKLGSAVLKRTARGALSAWELRVPMDSPVGSELDLTVDDGNNPPLALRSVRVALAPQPYLYFEVRSIAPLTAHFGKPKTEPPRYDLEAIRNALPKTMSVAHWQSPHPAGPIQPALAVPPSSPVLPGASIDVQSFAYVRPTRPGKPGLVSLRLDAAVLAHSRGLDDVRIVDATGRQIPYLVEREAEPLSIPLTAQPVAELAASVPTHHSHHRIALPYGTIPSARLELVTSARVFRRTVWLRTDASDAPREPPGSRWRTVGERFWEHTDRDTPAPPITFDLPFGTEFVVRIDDGDNSALPLKEANLLAPAYRLRFFRMPGQSASLAYGNPALNAPRYDLGLLAPELEGAPAEDTLLEAEPPARDAARVNDTTTRWFWVSLGAAVAVLLGLIARLLKRTEVTSPTESATGPKDAPRDG